MSYYYLLVRPFLYPYCTDLAPMNCIQCAQFPQKTASLVLNFTTRFISCQICLTSLVNFTSSSIPSVIFEVIWYILDRPFLPRNAVKIERELSTNDNFHVSEDAINMWKQHLSILKSRPYLIKTKPRIRDFYEQWWLVWVNTLLPRFTPCDAVYPMLSPRQMSDMANIERIWQLRC